MTSHIKFNSVQMYVLIPRTGLDLLQNFVILILSLNWSFNILSQIDLTFVDIFIRKKNYTNPPKFSLIFSRMADKFSIKS